MPELPEVERARKLIQESCKGYKIKSVDAREDKIVYTGGTDHNDFAKEVTGRTITGCERKGKTFWMTLSGKGRFPVMHFGMTGMIQLKGQEPTWYRRRPKENSSVWPPKFCKFILVLEPQSGSVSDEPRELAFLDGRRLGRIRLLPDPVTSHPPISLLGFDPVLNHPTLDEFKDLIAKKKGTVKGMIMDQAFSAGVGNWVADEVLYQARIHPSCPVPSLSEQNIKDLHHQIRAVPLKAVSVNADSRQFPEDWLFRWRWGKGAKQKKGSDKAKAKKVKVEEGEDEEGGEDIKPAGKKYLELPDGSPATIVFVEVGGRTTAVVEELQRMPDGVEIKPKISKGGKGSGGKKRVKEEESDEAVTSSASGSESDEVTTPKKATTSRQRAAAAAGSVKRVKPEPDVKKEPVTPARKARKTSTTDTPSSRRKADKVNGTASTKVRTKSTPSSVRKEPTSSAKASKNPVTNGKKPAGKGRGRRREASEESSELSDAPE
ncbi:formamidopyrimidine-DNA glycosylase [Kwoniella shandongensis]|uniref:Formamidopyrimidine-DNA glycosylase n=1 Tax=Kwoniella shandongensis TaxID=1734106 RepID=A0A5M6BUW2_9TREE|nr:formamidopyrimidine-DNA glycosylase [Kwoniella shandongensis]KAA5526656.1 formamidopyrimidine-DNA glycosylase [Kwoniella shandongensis]